MSPQQKIKKMYFADLTYNTGIIACDFVPLGAGYVASYAKALFGKEYDIKIFKFADELLEVSKNDPPDILGGSCYVWNKNLLLYTAQLIKEINPKCLIVSGGPAFPSDRKRQEEFLSQNKQIDFFIPYDGELAFANLIKKYLDAKENKEKIKNLAIDGVVYLDGKGEIISGNNIKRPKNLDIFPSPYLVGLLDKFFVDNKFTPMIQTTRGCPHMCTYCWASNEYNRHVSFFSLQRVNEELDYIRRIAAKNNIYDLLSCDANFGIYEKDFKILQTVLRMQQKYNYPRIFSVPYGKNVASRYINILTKIRGSSYCWSIQSTNTKILENVKRKRLDLKAIARYISGIHKMRRIIDTEIIIGLPYETRETHMRTIKDLLDCGFDHIDPFTFMLLDGIELDSEEAHRKFQYEIRYRIIPRNFGKINGKYCFEIERVVVGTNTYTFEDYIYFRSFHLLLKILLNDGAYNELLKYIKQCNAHVFDWLVFVFDDLRKNSSDAARCFSVFVNEAHSELWKSPEELVRHYSQEENYKKLLTRECGDNLLQKCVVLASSVYFDVFVNYFIKMAGRYLKGRFEKKCQLAEEISDIKNFIRAKLENVFSKNMQITRSFILQHDILKWNNDGLKKPLSAYRLRKPRSIIGKLSTEQVKFIRNLFNRYDINENNPFGLYRPTAIIRTDYYFRKIKWMPKRQTNT